MKTITLREILKSKKFIESDFRFFGEDIAKVEASHEREETGKLILVTSTSPTKYGEGKTTLAISLNDALNRLGKNSIVALREPSLGPVFGLKGGACGGGCAKIVPESEINLHFTGDIHAITTANNLLSAIIDNHIFQGNELNIDPAKITHERCMDLNDRSLRNLKINGVDVHFNISTASEMMAILCLSKNENDLKTRLGNILVGYTYEEKEVFARDLQCVNALFLLLKDALKPNMVKTLENNLALVHGGPFANIAHGTNSIISTNYGLNNFDYTIVEAGFGSDMGALKFFDIVVRNNPDLLPSVIVINTTIQSLKYNGEGLLEKGIENLEYHVNNMKKYSDSILVVLNKHENDLESDIAYIKRFVEEQNLLFSISTGYLDGSSGSTDVAEKIIELSSKKQNSFFESYGLEENLQEKIEKFCKINYGVKEILYTDNALEKIKLIEQSQCKKLPICIAKTQVSITDSAKVLGYPKDFTMTVKDIKLFSGAGFITVYFGSILTMPGLSKDAKYLSM